MGRNPWKSGLRFVGAFLEKAAPAADASKPGEP